MISKTNYISLISVFFVKTSLTHNLFFCIIIVCVVLSPVNVHSGQAALELSLLASKEMKQKKLYSVFQMSCCPQFTNLIDRWDLCG